MQIAALGSLGLGLAWGWLIGLFSRSVQSFRLFHILALGAATALLALETWLLRYLQAALFFLAATAFAAGCHLIWLYYLRQRG